MEPSHIIYVFVRRLRRPMSSSSIPDSLLVKCLERGPPNRALRYGGLALALWTRSPIHPRYQTTIATFCGRW